MRPRRTHTLLTILCCLVLNNTCADAWSLWPFSSKKFSGNAMLEAGSMGIHRGDRVIAFGDFNGDQFLDVVTLDADAQTLAIHLWDHDEFTFKQSASFRHPSRISNVIPGDFTHSGKLDLLVMSTQTSSGPLEMYIYPSLPGGGFDTQNPLSLPSSTLSQPIPIDLDGDLRIDLLGSTYPRSSTLQAWQNVWNASQPHEPIFKVIDAPVKSNNCVISNPHSNAVVDLDGDCLADLFLVCDDGRGGKTFQIWINKKDDGFTLSQQGSLPAGVQAISFADADRDGTIDLIFPTCTSVSSSTGVGRDCSINVIFNQQLPLCSSTTDSGLRDSNVRVCRPPGDLCMTDPNFKLDLQNILTIPLTELFGESGGDMLVFDTTFSPSIPLPLKIGDANLDGFPDLLFIHVEQSTQARIPKLLYGASCSVDRGAAGCTLDRAGSTMGRGKTGMRVATKKMEALDAITDARGLAFLDMDEDGTLDIMVQRTGDAGQGKIMFMQNNFYYDAFFLKAIVLNGACGNRWCYSSDGKQRYHPFGVSYSGASYKYTVLDTSGRRSAAQVGQLPQTSYHALQTPYSFFGLGRTNNYIENLFVGSTSHSSGDGHFINMEGVIPNSKVVILPSANEGEAWKRQLFLRPGEWIPWVLLTVVIGTVILAIIVLILHLNEKREDELERRKISHHINFDAL